MRVIKIELDRDIKQLQIVPMADWHIGDVFSDAVKIQQYIDYVKDNKNAYAILNGDLLNTALKTSVSDVYSEQLTPSEQLRKAASLLKPIKDKILAILPGNHENRVLRNDGIDITELLAIELGIADRYAPESAVIFLKFGLKSLQHDKKNQQQMLYVINVIHGTGGGKRPGSKINKLEDMASVVSADIYIHSHTHLPAIFKQNFFTTNLTHCSLEEKTRLFVNTSSTLRYGGYGERYGFAPACSDTPIIILSGTERKMEAIL